MDLSLERRIAGVLVPIFAIRGRGDLGIGDAHSLMEFIDWAREAGFGLVKILPINETGGDHSPYNALSARALDPTTIRTTPEALPDLKRTDYDAVLAGLDLTQLGEGSVQYSVVKPLKHRLLNAAFQRFSRNHLARSTHRAAEYRAFLEAEAEWLQDYTLFRLFFEEHGGERWDRWPDEHRTPSAGRQWIASLPKRKSAALEKRLAYFAYVQWIAFTQWREAKVHAERAGVALMGDIPFGVSFHSADVWAAPHFFRSGWSGGTPPDRVFKHDAFVQKWGQNWGIPLYDWDAMRADNFHWWRRRVHGVREFFHLFRIDHVLGFYRIYGFPWRPEENGEYLSLDVDTARARANGQSPGFQPRPDDNEGNKERNRIEGEEYLRAIVHEAGVGRVIGEDLGEVPDYVRPNLALLGIAGYKIPAWEKRNDGELIPGAEYERLSLATYGTHDHAPLRAMWEHYAAEAAQSGGDSARHELHLLARYAGLAQGHPLEQFTPEIHGALLAALFRSNSWIAIAMITDVFGRQERFNQPGVFGDENWTQRMHVPVVALFDDPGTDHVRQILRESGRFLP